MAEAPTVVRSLFVTLRRGFVGKPWMNRRVLDALGLSKRHHCVEKPNNESIRSMIAKVPHLVIVETDRMFNLKRMREYYRQLCRPPIIVDHANAVPPTQQVPTTAFVRTQHREHVLPTRMSGFDKLWLPKPPRTFDKVKTTNHRAKLLVEHGLYSQRVRALNEKAMETPKRYGKREGKNE